MSTTRSKRQYLAKQCQKYAKLYNKYHDQAYKEAYEMYLTRYKKEVIS